MPGFEFEPLAESPVAAAARPDRLSLAAVDGAAVPGGRLRVLLGPRIIGGRYFRLLLDQGAGQPRQIVQGLYNDGVYPGQNWAEVFDVDLPPGLEGLDGWVDSLAPYLAPLGAATPPGGHVMIEYEKPMWRDTQRGLLAGIPPLATSLGGLLRAIGSGDSFKDWYFPEGGQEGGRKLQGNRAFTPEQAKAMAAARATELRAFLATEPRGDAAIDARARLQAKRVLDELG